MKVSRLKEVLSEIPDDFDIIFNMVYETGTKYCDCTMPESDSNFSVRTIKCFGFDSDSNRKMVSFYLGNK